MNFSAYEFSVHRGNLLGEFEYNLEFKFYFSYSFSSKSLVRSDKHLVVVVVH